MKFLNSMKLGRKLTLMVAIPAVILLGFASVVEIQSIIERQDALKLRTEAALSVKFSSLVHEMQKERGMTAGFIGSEGGRFASEIRAQRAETDSRREDLEKFLEEYDASTLDAEFAASLNAAMDRLTQMGGIRQRVDNLSIQLGEALGYYTGNNAAFLSMISDMAVLSPC